MSRRSISGIIVYVGETSITWKSTRQTAIYPSTYGAELCTGRVATEEGIGIRFLLRSLGVPFDGPTIQYRDNIGMLQASIFPDNILKKKNSAISYHFLRENVAAGTIILKFVKTSERTQKMPTP